jgi:hypothetical protein
VLPEAGIYTPPPLFLDVKDKIAAKDRRICTKYELKMLYYQISFPLS